MNSKSDSATPDTRPARRAPLRFAVASLFAIFYWPVGALILLIASVVPGLFMRMEARRRLGQKLVSTLLGGFMSGLEGLGIIQIHDEELKMAANLPGPLIVACNHPALWDAPIVLRRFPQVSCIMKADLLENPLLRNGALFAGFLPNAPRLKMVRKAVERLNAAGHLLMFPEGTRTRQEQGVINELRPGLALLAKESGAPVLPVFITSSSGYLQKGWPIHRMPELPVSVWIRVGEVVHILPDEEVREFSQRMEEVFKVGLG
ncbi:MAG: lysophospholipid acyltransferase family protein [Luteolibacter sp.]